MIQDCSLSSEVKLASRRNAIYQLLQASQGATTTESYTYDAVGNKLSSLTVPQWNYNASNELTSNSAVSFAYDNNGNTVNKTVSSGTTVYAWDFENRMISAVVPDGTVTFRYDPFGRRIQKAFTQGSTTTATNYLYDDANDVAEVDQGGNLLARYTQGAGIDEPLAELRSGTSSYYEQDGLGSVTSLSTSTGSLGNTYVYKPFGDLAASTGSTANPFQYTGRDYDPETGLRYYRARYYSADTGRFLSEGPALFLVGENFYAYVGNRPTSSIDPFGIQALPNPVPVRVPVPAPGPLIINLEGPAMLSLIIYEVQLGVETVQTVQAINSANAADSQLALAQNNLIQVLQQMKSGPYGSSALNYLSNQAKKKCQNNGCQPCIPPVGTIAYRLDTTGPAHRGVPTPHWHLYMMQQNPPPSCQCQWVDIKDNQEGFGPGTHHRIRFRSRMLQEEDACEPPTNSLRRSLTQKRVCARLLD